MQHTYPSVKMFNYASMQCSTEYCILQVCTTGTTDLQWKVGWIYKKRRERKVLVHISRVHACIADKRKCNAASVTSAPLSINSMQFFQLEQESFENIGLTDQSSIKERELLHVKVRLFLQMRFLSMMKSTMTEGCWFNCIGKKNCAKLADSLLVC